MAKLSCVVGCVVAGAYMAVGRFWRLLCIARRWLVRLLAAPSCCGCDALLHDDNRGGQSPGINAASRAQAHAVTAVDWCAGCEPPLRSLQLELADPANPTARPLRVYAAGHYESRALAAAIQKLKYRDRSDVAEALSRVAWRALPKERRWDAVVPVPLHARRLAERGYNQAALVARHLAEKLQLPLAVGCLRRTRVTEAQASLSRAQRLTNVAGAFVLRGLPKATRILLVDDVTTTGATLHACARQLRAAGIEVDALVVAVADRSPACASLAEVAAVSG